MAENPIGTITDEERLVPLLAADGALLVDVTDPVQMTEVPEEGPFAWRLLDEGDVPRLAFAPVDSSDEAGDLPIRDLSPSGDAVTIEVPEPLVKGLGLDTGGYDGDNPLLFKPDEISDGIAVGLNREGEPGGSEQRAVELTPVRFADGTPFRDEPLRDTSTDSDPVAEGKLARDQGEDATPTAEAISAPVDTPVVEEILVATNAPRDEVVRALETIARHDLVGEADAQVDPVAVDDRIVLALDAETWEEKIARRLDVGESAVEAAREIHARQAEDALRKTGRDVDPYLDRVPLVIRYDRPHEDGSEPEWSP